MAGLKIEGDLSQISEPQIKYIKSIIEERGYKDNKVIIKAVGQAGDNYVANVKRIIIEDGNGGAFKMVAKVAPAQELLRKMANTELLFRNEHIIYTKVLPKLTQLEKTAAVPSEERLRYAACYGSSSDVPNEVILLEDLNEANFTILDRFKPISPDCVKSVLKNFASFHSLSYALKYKEPEIFDEFKNSFFDSWAAMFGIPEITLHFGQIENNAISIVDSDVHKKALKGAIIKSLELIAKMAKYEKNSKHAVIQQGDAWTNNILFKIDGETVLGSIMIDYQMPKATHPVADILYMILNCTDHEMRKTHFYDWIEYYHSELDKSLSNYGLKANFVYPRDQLDSDLKRYGKISFGLSILLATILSLKNEEASKMKEAMEAEDALAFSQNENPLASLDADTIALTKKRLEGLVDSCHEFGLI